MPQRHRALEVGHDSVGSPLLALISLAALGCSGEPPVAVDRLFGQLDSKPRIWQPAERDGHFELVLESSLGEPEGPFAFSRVGAIAARTDGLIAIVDELECQIVLAKYTTGGLIRRMGGCGGGPGEFRRPNGLAFIGDSLFIWDEGLRSVIVMTFDGEETRRFAPGALMEMPLVLRMGASSDTTLVFDIGLAPPAVVDVAASDDLLLAVIDSRSGKLLRRALADPMISATNPLNRIRDAPVCAQSQAGGFIAAFNRWAFEGITLDATASSVRGHFLTDLPAMTPATRDGKRYPTLATSIACAGVGVMYQAVRTERRESVWYGVDGYLEVRDVAGIPLLRRRFGEQDSTLIGRALAGSGDRFFLQASRRYEYPAVLVLRLRRR